MYLRWSFAALARRSVTWCQLSLRIRGGWGGRGSVSTCPTRCGTTSGGRGTGRSHSQTNANADRETGKWQGSREFVNQRNEGEIESRERKRQKDRELLSETQWTSETDRPRQRSGHYLGGVLLTVECLRWHQRKRRQLTLPQHCRLAGCDVQGSCYIRGHKMMTLLHLFQAWTWSAVSCSLSKFNTAAEQRDCSWRDEHRNKDTKYIIYNNNYNHKWFIFILFRIKSVTRQNLILSCQNILNFYFLSV